MMANVRRGVSVRSFCARYEKLNVFGSPTGAVVHVRRGDATIRCRWHAVPMPGQRYNLPPEQRAMNGALYADV